MPLLDTTSPWRCWATAVAAALLPIVIGGTLPAVAQDACRVASGGFGTVPVLFDDFVYDRATTERDGDDTDRSIFGEMPWYTAPRRASYSRAWTRFNAYDAPADRLWMEGDTLVFRSTTADAVAPTIQSGFRTETGTYAAAVWLDDLAPTDRVIQSLWVIEPNVFVFDTPTDGLVDARLEVDLEYSQWLTRDGLPHLVASSKRSKRYEGGYQQREASLDCLVLGETLQLARGCVSRGGRSLLADRWAILALRISRERVSFAAYAPPTSDRPAVWAGDVLEPEPVRRREAWHGLGDRNYAPDEPVLTALTQAIHNRDAPLSKPYTMRIDWFAYLPCDALSMRDVLNTVDQVRRLDAPRVNTTGAGLFTPPLPRNQPHGVRIDGPDTLSVGRTGRWKVVPTRRESRYVTDYAMRILRRDGQASPWRPLYEPVATYTPRRGDARLEFRVTLRDYWLPHGHLDERNYRATAVHRVAIELPATD